MPTSEPNRTQNVVYILECSDGSYYTGSTNDLERRLHEHNHAKIGAHYTKIRRPVHLVYFEIQATLSEARKREYVIKQLTRSQKESLIRKVPFIDLPVQSIDPLDSTLLPLTRANN